MGAGLGGVACAYEMKKKLGAAHQRHAGRQLAVLRVHAVESVDGRRLAQARADPRRPRGAACRQGRALAAEVRAGHRCGQIRGSCCRTAPKSSTTTTSSSRPARSSPSTKCRVSARTGTRVSICTQAHALAAWEQYQEFVKNPGPIVVGAAGSASCFGPAYEMAMILDTDLRRRKIRDKVPMTYVTVGALHRPHGPRRRGRQQGADGIDAAPAPHQVDHQREDHLGRGRHGARRRNTTRTGPCGRSTSCPSSTR